MREKMRRSSLLSCLAIIFLGKPSSDWERSWLNSSGCHCLRFYQCAVFLREIILLDLPLFAGISSYGRASLMFECANCRDSTTLKKLPPQHEVWTSLRSLLVVSLADAA